MASYTPGTPDLPGGPARFLACLTSLGGSATKGAVTTRLVDDFGVTEKTVYRWARTLRDAGQIVWRRLPHPGERVYILVNSEGSLPSPVGMSRPHSITDEIPRKTGYPPERNDSRMGGGHAQPTTGLDIDQLTQEGAVAGDPLIVHRRCPVPHHHLLSGPQYGRPHGKRLQIGRHLIAVYFEDGDAVLVPRDTDEFHRWIASPMPETQIEHTATPRRDGEDQFAAFRRERQALAARYAHPQPHEEISALAWALRLRQAGAWFLGVDRFGRRMYLGLQWRHAPQSVYVIAQPPRDDPNYVAPGEQIRSTRSAWLAHLKVHPLLLTTASADRILAGMPYDEAGMCTVCGGRLGGLGGEYVVCGECDREAIAAYRAQEREGARMFKGECHS